MATATGRKNPPFPRKRGISHTNCSFQYAERKLATSRAILLDCRQVKCIRLEFVRGDSPQKIPRFRGNGGFRVEIVRPNTQSVSQRPVERAQWSDLTTGLPERIGSRHCRATGRAVLLDGSRVKPPDRSLVSARRIGKNHFTAKSPVSPETGDFCRQGRQPIRSGRPAACPAPAIAFRLLSDSSNVLTCYH